MRKKLFALLLAVLLAVGALPMAASAAESGTLGTLNWKYENNVLTINGNGPIPDFEQEFQPWYNAVSYQEVDAIIVEPGITSIGTNAFSTVRSKSISIANTVASIGDYAFYGCQPSTPIAELDIPGNVKTIGANAFGAANVKKIVLHEGTTTIGYKAFAESPVETIYLPASLKNVKFDEEYIGVGSNSGGFRLLKDVHYGGSESEAKANKIDLYVQWLTNDGPTIHYNSVAPGTPDVPSRPTVGGFSDVFEGEYYADPVKWAVENKITQGETSTTFAPNKTCTRGQIVTFLWRANGSPEPSSTVNPFVDVKAGEYYYKAMLWAKEKGITSGTDDTHFSPNAACNRAQAVTFLWRANNKPAGSGSSFGDVPSGEYYAEAVKWANGAGVTSGETSTTFAPNKSCTRGQIVTFLYRDKN